MTQAHPTCLDWVTGAAPEELSLIHPTQGWPYLRHQAYLVVKRVIDVILACILLVLTLPILLLSAIAVKVTSRGPLLFCQVRAGLGGEPFVMYKLRTMRKDALQERDELVGYNDLGDVPVFKIRRDPRITRVGRLLRRSSIDELPQLINVLRGQMALVGPRPLPLDEIRADAWGESLRLSVKPGLTCLWQIAGRTEIPYREWMQLDGYYVQNRSTTLDLKILLKTIPAVLSGRGAY
jgi:lipopolysaccharide/colanic/teichoic acid biosynthesis glycosyltransferase